MNHSLLNADRATQFKITAVALIAVAAVVVVGITARVTRTEADAQAKITVIKAGTPVMYTTREFLAIR
jgi:ABC-type molybdate transport system substrate-binding protein